MGEPISLRVCATDNCSGPFFARGYCKMHYEMGRRRKEFRTRKNHKAGTVPCKVMGCTFPARSLGLCGTHYARHHRHGSTTLGETPLRSDEAKMLLSYVNYAGSECLELPFRRRHVHGYGQLVIDGLMTNASRHMAIQKFGKLPSHIHALHKCDNPKCVNPNHLFLGTAKVNHDDSVAKGRHVPPPHVPGEKNGEAKITQAQVVWAREALKTMTGRTVAKMLGISEAQMSRIKHKTIWKCAL